jgi:hypothetical protein
MKYVLSILSLFISLCMSAQKADTDLLSKAMKDFDNALLNQDSMSLKRLLHNNLVYGHSNGWMETKRELISDLFNGKISYKKITPGHKEMMVDGNTVAARMDADIDAEMEGKVLSFKLKILQVWVWKNKHWELFARQSVKI